LNRADVREDGANAVVSVVFPASVVVLVLPKSGRHHVEPVLSRIERS
jgi:hypothetical protein